MNKNRLCKTIDKYYFSNHQHLEVDTWEMMEGNGRDCMFDVHLCDKKDTYLFTIQNYNGLINADHVFSNYFPTYRHVFSEKWDGVKASYIPLYMDRTVTLKTFKDITKEDIINATRYFLHEVLDARVYFNMDFKKAKEEIEIGNDSFFNGEKFI